MTSAVTLNSFQLLGDNDVDDPQLISANIKKPEPTPVPAATPEKPKKVSNPGNKENTVSSDVGRGARTGRGVRGGRGGGRGGRGRGASGYEDNGVEFAAPESHDNAREGGVSRGGRLGRGGRSGGRGRREYDRHDGTGRAHEGMKRGGAGKGNWGVQGEDEPSGAIEESTPVPEDGNEQTGDEVNVEEEAEAEKAEPEPAPEPEQVQISFEEYQKSLEESRVGLNKVANVGQVDESQFKGMSTVQRAKAEDSDVLAVSGSKSKRERQRKERDSKAADASQLLGFSMSTESGDRGDRRGRGERRGGRGGGGRGERRGRGGYDDDNSFGGRSGRGRGGRGRGRGSYGESAGNEGAAEENVENTEEAGYAAPSYNGASNSGGRGRGRGNYGRGGSQYYRDRGSAGPSDLSLGDDNFPVLA